MRTDVHVAGQAVLAVVLADVESSLKFQVSTIRNSIVRGGFGHTRVTKDFLLPGTTAEVVHRDGDSKRRKCDAIDLRKLDEETVMQLKSGNSLTALLLPIQYPSQLRLWHKYSNRIASSGTRREIGNLLFRLVIIILNSKGKLTNHSIVQEPNRALLKSQVGQALLRL